MATILVIEDELDLQTVLDFNLRQAGYDVLLAATGTQGIALCIEKLPDLVILDLMLPDIPGTDVCRTLRRNPATQRTPIVMLTAKSEEIDRVVGFELGADDYVTKPFSMRELLLRIQAVLRRAHGEGNRDPSSIIQFGCLRIDREAHRVWVADQEVTLTPIELKLLVLLHDRRNRVQSRETLLEDIWEMSTEITTRTVDTHIKRLREKLGPASEYVETVRGTGYRFAETPRKTGP
ncbi:MAG: response regulator transcription factor [Pseudomonadota bacterium]